MGLDCERDEEGSEGLVKALSRYAAADKKLQPKKVLPSPFCPLLFGHSLLFFFFFHPLFRRHSPPNLGYTLFLSASSTQRYMPSLGRCSNAGCEHGDGRREGDGRGGEFAYPRHDGVRRTSKIVPNESSPEIACPAVAAARRRGGPFVAGFCEFKTMEIARERDTEGRATIAAGRRSRDSEKIRFAKRTRDFYHEPQDICKTLNFIEL